MGTQTEGVKEQSKYSLRQMMDEERQRLRQENSELSQLISELQNNSIPNIIQHYEEMVWGGGSDWYCRSTSWRGKC